MTRYFLLSLPQQLQDRDLEVAELQEEMARGATALEELSAQLEEERLRANPVVTNSALQKVRVHCAMAQLVEVCLVL